MAGGVGWRMKTTLIALLALGLCLPLGCGKKPVVEQQAKAKAPSSPAAPAPKEPTPQPKPKEPTEGMKPLPKDFKSLKTLAEKGIARAQHNLGSMYYHGKGVVRDHKEAVKWFRKAALQGNARGQFSLGWMYLGGEGVDKDAKESIKWYRKAAEQGLAVAQYQLGVFYSNGTTKDDKESAKWYRKAALQGFAIAQRNLGVKYSLGRGVQQDQVTAYAWAHIATVNGDKTAPKFKAFLATKMTPGQIAKAQALAKEMTKKNPRLLENETHPLTTPQGISP